MLVEGIETAKFKDAFKNYVNAENPWVSDFLIFALSNKLESRTIGELIAEADTLPIRQGASIRELSPGYLVAEGEVGLARRIAMSAPALQRPAPRGFPSDPEFEGKPIIAPFNWTLTRNTIVSFTGLGNPNEPLHFTSATAYSGELASQMTNLAPGRYQLSSKGRLGDNVEWAITCAGTGQVVLDNVSNGPRQFIVPSDECEGQWLRLNAMALGAVDASIESVSIRRVDG